MWSWNVAMSKLFQLRVLNKLKEINMETAKELEYKAEIKRLKGELKKLDEHYILLEKSLAYSDHRTNDFMLENENLKFQINDLKSKLERSAETKTKLATENRSLQTEIEDLKDLDQQNNQLINRLNQNVIDVNAGNKRLQDKSVNDLLIRDFIQLSKDYIELLKQK